MNVLDHGRHLIAILGIAEVQIIDQIAVQFRSGRKAPARILSENIGILEGERIPEKKEVGGLAYRGNPGRVIRETNHAVLLGKEAVPPLYGDFLESEMKACGEIVIPPSGIKTKIEKPDIPDENVGRA